MDAVNPEVTPEEPTYAPGLPAAAVTDAVGPVVTDTNVLVYALDPGEPPRRSVAREVLRALAERGDWLLPVQVMSELSNVALRKLGLTPDAVRDLLAVHRRAAARVLPLRPPVVDEALRGVREHGLSFYDAQIWAAARLAGAQTLLTEDLQTGRSLDGVRIVDPFTETGR